MAINTYLSTITLTANGLNTPRHMETEWTTKQHPYIRCQQETDFCLKDKHRLKVKG